MLGFVASGPQALAAAPGVGDALSGIFGSVSLTAWICLLLPQLITNYKAKSADALSMKFLLIWLLGDIANLSGALFTSLAPSTIAIASYFCVADLILISQCTYYNTLNARRREKHQQHHHHHHHHHRPRPSITDDQLDASTSTSAALDPTTPTESDPLLLSTSSAAPTTTPRRHSSRSRRESSSALDPLARIVTGGEGGGGDASDGARRVWVYNLLSLVAVWVVGGAGWLASYKMGAWDVGGGDVPMVPGDGGEELVKEPTAVVGMVLGYASAVCYLCARIPQIIKNYREKSCEGLALLFFLLSLTGNFTYGASVMAYSQERDYFIRALPWLLGSLGTMVEDGIIFVQFRIYSPKRQAKTGGTA